MNNQQPQCSYCGDMLKVVDRHKSSKAFRCATCGRCFLHPGCVDVLIRLDSFQRMRGHGRRPYDDHTMAEELVQALSFDCWPSPAKIVDFGIDSSGHLGALQYAVECGVTAYDLDRVLGDGPAITALVRSVPQQPFAGLEFRTVWDSQAVRDEEPIEV